jgi:hypothetical protein
VPFVHITYGYDEVDIDVLKQGMGLASSDVNRQLLLYNKRLYELQGDHLVPICSHDQAGDEIARIIGA